MSYNASSSIRLKLLVGKENSKVVFGECNGDFVDVLLSFMTMPIGHIIRLAREHSLPEQFGCVNNIYESVENLDDENFQSLKCKDMLLRPRSAAEFYCMNLKLDVVDSATNVYYSCFEHHCFGPYCGALCYCGNNMGWKWTRNNILSFSKGGVFLKPISRLIMTRDLQVKPGSTMTCVDLLSKFEAMKGRTREERIINIGMCEILLDSTVDKSSFGVCHKQCGPRSMNQPERSMEEAKIALKLIIQKSSNKALYVEAKEDFVNLIGSFLTYPLGFVLEKLPFLSSRGCWGNLYKSIQEFAGDELFKSEEMKAIVVNPKLPRGLALHKQLIPIEEASYPSDSGYFSSCPLKRIGDPEQAITGSGFFRGTSMFMVKDDLTITPLSPMSVVCFLDKFKIPVIDIVEQEVTLGQDEAMRLLAAALVSKTALSDVFMVKELKQEILEFGTKFSNG